MPVDQPTAPWCAGGRDWGVRVKTFEFGYVSTDMWLTRDHPERIQTVCSSGEVAPAPRHFASGTASFAAGTVAVLNGSYTIV